MVTIGPRHLDTASTTVLDALPVVAYMTDAHGRFTYLSRAWEQLTGLTTGAILANGYSSIIHPDDVAQVVSTWEAARATGESYRDDLRIRCGPGYRWVVNAADPMCAADGAIAGWFGTLTDVHELRIAETEMARAVDVSTAITRDVDARAEFVEALMDASDGCVQVLDVNGRLVSMQPDREHALATVGAGGPAIGDRWLDAWSPDDRAPAERAVTTARSGGSGRFTGRFGDRSEAKWWDVTVTPIAADANGRPAQLLAVLRDVTEMLHVHRSVGEPHAQRASEQMRTLAEMSEIMFHSLDFDQTLLNVTRTITREYATICIIDMVEADGDVANVAATHVDETRRDHVRQAVTARKLHPNHPVMRAVRDGLLTLAPQDADRAPMSADAGFGQELISLGIRSLICEPLRAGKDGAIIGALTFALDETSARHAYTSDDLRFAQQVAERAGRALDHARAYARERRIAVTLQEASLPKSLPTIDHLYLSADYRPGNHEAANGGDWYDAYLLEDGRVAITVGDVLGNGLHAAVTMAKLRQAMRSVAALRPEPNAMLEVADRTVREESADMYATALAGIFDPVSHEFTFASAGHPGPVLLHADGRIEEFSTPGLLLGLRPRGETQTVTITAPPGSSLVFFTDGLTESTHDIDEGYRRIRAAMSDTSVTTADNPANKLVEHVLAGALAKDDIAVLVAEVGPSPRFDERMRSAEAKAQAEPSHDEPLSLHKHAAESSEQASAA